MNFEFTIRVPELAIVRFVVEDYDTTSANDFIGQYTIPLTSMQYGKSAQLQTQKKKPNHAHFRCWFPEVV